MGAGLGVGIAMAGFWVCGGNEKYVQAARLLDIETIEDRMRCPSSESRYSLSVKPETPGRVFELL